MKLERLHRRRASATAARFVLRYGARLGLALLAIALLTMRGASQTPSFDFHERNLQATGSSGPTLVPCGFLPAGTTTWSAAGSPYILPLNTANDPVKTPGDCPSFTDPPGPTPPGVIVRPGSTLVIDASQGPVQIFSHGAGIYVDGGSLETTGTGTSNGDFVFFDAEPDVASWDGIGIHADPNTGDRGNASLSYTSIQHALTAIAIDSAAVTGPGGTGSYGLTLVNSGVVNSYFDGIDTTDTPISVIGNVDSKTGRPDGRFGTLNNIGSFGIRATFDQSSPAVAGDALDIENMTFGSSVPFGETACNPLSPCAAGTIGNDAIQATFPSGAALPAVINNNDVFRAGNFGVELDNPNGPTLQNNLFNCNGTGSPDPTHTCAPIGAGLSSPVYLNNATADLESKVTGNQGTQDGLEAIVFNGTVTSPTFTWKTAAAAPPNLGYVLNGDLDMTGGVFRVPPGGVVKVKGGSLNLTNVTLDASNPNPNNPPTVFTSLRDTSYGINAGCSVFIQVCSPPQPLPPGDWGGINLIGQGQTPTANGTLNNVKIEYANTAIDITNGATASVNHINSPTADGPNYGLVVANSFIGPTFADGLMAVETPISVVGSEFACPTTTCSNPTALRNHGVVADFSGATAPLAGGLKLDGNTFTTTGNQAILGESLTSPGAVAQQVIVTNNAITGAGTFGIELDNATNPTVTNNAVNGSGIGSTTYPAMYLPNLNSADFNAAINGNSGSGNGLDAIAFHGSTHTSLAWQTVHASPLLGYIVDGNLTVNGSLTLASADYAPVLGGTITVSGGSLSSTGAVFSSLKEQTAAIPSCGSVFVPRASGVCANPAAGDWGGLILDSTKANALSGSEIRYPTTGISIGKGSSALGGPNLTLTTTNIIKTSADGIQSQSGVSVTGGAFTNNGATAISVDLTSTGAVANQPLDISNASISNSGADGIDGVSLTDEPVSIGNTTVNGSGGYGIHLQSAKHDPVLTNNTVTGAGAGYAAIFVDGYKGDFANHVTGNQGASNGLDAIAFHGEITGDLTWRTARKTSDPTRLLGYLLDSGLTMDPGKTLTVNAGDIVKVGNGGVLNLQGVTLKGDDTSTSSPKVFTSLTDNSIGVAACPSQLIPSCGPSTKPAGGDWGGIALTGANANGALVNAAIRYAATGLEINSGATSTLGTSTFGLVVSRSSISSSKMDAIDSTGTSTSVTDSMIDGAAYGINATAANGSFLRFSGNRFMSARADAIFGQALAGQPVWITDNHIQGAGNFGIRLLGANELVLRNNNVSGSGGGPTAGAGRYPAIYLNAVTADFVRNVRGNVGGGNGLDAIAMDGTVQGDLPWQTPSNQASTHPLGYLLDGGLTIVDGQLSVPSGGVVKAAGGPITIKGGSVQVAGTATGVSTTSLSGIFTSLKDDPATPTTPVDQSNANAVSCPSVLATICSPEPGDWGGLVITTDSSGAQGTGNITYGWLNYANTAISIDSGPVTSTSPNLTVTNSTIRNTSKDGINALDSPVDVESSIIGDSGAGATNIAGHGIIASFLSPANCPTSCVRLSANNNFIYWTGQDGIVANGLGGQPTVVSGNTLDHAGTYGIRLVGADHLTLTDNTITDSGGPTTSFRYPAIYLNGVKADFELTSAPNTVAANHGTGNGINAIVAHGEATRPMTWLTPSTASAPFGYLLDGGLMVDGNLTTNPGDVVKVLGGAIKVNGALSATGTTFTSLKDTSVPETVCDGTFGSVFANRPCAAPSASDWGGINIDAADSHFDSSRLSYSSSGVSINAGVLHSTGALFSGLSGYAITTSGTGSAVVDCDSIHGNAAGILSQGSPGTTVTNSDLYGNTGADINADFNTPVATKATSDWWGTATPSPTQYSPSVKVTNPLPVDPPTFKAAGGMVQFASTNTNAASGDFGKGTLTVTLTSDREVDPTAQPAVSFEGPSETVPHPVSGSWQSDNLTWIGTATIDPTTNAPGLQTLSISGAKSCIVDGANTMTTPETATFKLDFSLPTIAGTGGAKNVGASSATLTDSVNPIGWSQSTDSYVFFQYKKDGDTYNPNTPADLQALTSNPTSLFGYATIGHGTTGVPVSASIPPSTLQASTLYDYRVIGVNLNGIQIGSDQQFTTTGPASKLQISDPSPQAGSSVDETISAVDASNNVVADYAGSVSVTSTDPQSVWTLKGSGITPAAFPAALTFAPSDLGTETLSVTFKTAGTQTLTASATGLTSATQNESITPAPTSQLVFGSLASSTTAGTSTSFSLTAEDAYGNTTPTYTGTVHFTSSDSQATLPTDYTFTSGDLGTQTFTATLKTSGTQLLSATDTVTSSITGSHSILVTAANAATLSLTGYPSTTTAGVANSFVVEAFDQYNNVATGYTGTVHFTSSDSQAVLPADYTFTSGDAGSHSFSATLETAGTQSLTATDTVDSSLTATESGITVNPAAAASLQLTGLSGGTAGTAQTAVITAKDAFNNTATGYTGAVHFSSSDPHATLPANYTFVSGDSGTHSFPNGVVLTTAGSQSVTATDNGNAVTGSQSGLVVTPSSTVSLELTAPSNATAGVAQDVTVTAKDTFANTTPTYAGTVHFTTSDGAGTVPADYTFVSADNGSHLFSGGVTLDTAGSQTVTATDNADSSITGSQTITVNAAAAASLQLTGLSGGTAGTMQTPVVTAKDAFNNTATGYIGTVTFASSDPHATVPADYTFVGGDAGSHSFTNGVVLTTVGSQSVTVTDTVNGSLTASQTALVITPASTNQLAVSGLANPATAGVATSATVTAEDAYGNTTPTYTGTVHFTSTDGAATLPADYTFVSGDNGVHTFSAGVTLDTAGSQTTAATDTGNSSITGSQTITVNPAAAASLQLSGLSGGTAGTMQTAIVTAKDAFNNTATGYTGTVKFASSDGQATLPADYTFVSGDAGSHTFTNGVVLKTAGSQSVTVTDSVDSSLTATQSGLAITPGAATTFSLSAPASVTNGTAFSVTVTAQDAYGNTATAYTGAVHFTSSDTSAVLPADYTFTTGAGQDNGVHTLQVTLNTTGSQSVAATDIGNPSITGSVSTTVS